MKAKGKVTITTMPCCKQNQLTMVCFKSLASSLPLNQSIVSQQETLVASVKKYLKLPKGAGRISEAFQSTLQAMNVKRQA